MRLSFLLLNPAGSNLRRFGSHLITKYIIPIADFSWKLLLVISIRYSLEKYVFSISLTQGPSMWPIINEEQDLLLVDKLRPKIFGYKIGDIVVCKNPMNVFSLVCKRIYATAGDSFIVVNQGGNHSQRVLIPEGHVYLLGDNAANSMDSRYYGPVSTNMIAGKVLFKIWPLWGIKSIYSRDKQ